MRCLNEHIRGSVCTRESTRTEAHDGLLNPGSLAPGLGSNFVARQAFQRLPGFLRQGFSQLDYLGMSIHAKDKVNPLAMPTIQWSRSAISK